MKTLKQLETATNQYLKDNWEWGGTSEFDTSINDISRKKLYVFAKQNGGFCYVYKINPWNNELFYKRYSIGESVYNFSWDIATARKNKTIINTISERNKPGKYDRNKNKQEIDTIYNELDKVNGINLIWS